MKTHDELVEAIYNNPSYRSEILCIINLRAKLESAMKDFYASTSPEPSRLGGVVVRMIRYEDLIGRPILPAADSPEIHRCRSGITLLYSALLKGLMHAHELSTQQANKALLDVLTLHMNDQKIR